MKLSDPLKNFLEIAGLFILSLTVFLFGVNTQEVIGFDSRFYLFALEMWRHGPSLFPMTYDQPYPDYPATSTFLIYLTAHFLGAMNKLAAVLPSAIAAALTVVVTYLIGSLHSKRWGLYAVFFLMMTITFFKSARAISLDMYPTLFTATIFYLMYSSDLKHEKERLWFIYPLLFLGFAFRGPIGLVLPTGVICTYYFLDKNFKNFFFSSASSVLILFISGMILLALAQHVGGYGFEQDVIRMEMAGRIDQSFLPKYFYFTNSLGNYAASYPLTLFVFIGAAYYLFVLHHKEPELKLMVKLFGWMLIVLLGMSIPGDKKIRYILPMVPAIALIASYPFIASSREIYFTYMRWILLRIMLVLPAIFMIGVAILARYANTHAMPFNIHYKSIVTLLTTIQVTSLMAYFQMLKRIDLRDGIIFSAALAAFFVVYIRAIEPAELYIDRANSFVMDVETARLADHAMLAFYKESPDGLPIKYLINSPHEVAPIFLSTRQALMSFDQPAVYVMSEEYFRELPLSDASQFQVIAKDKMGHTPVVAVTRINL